MSNVHQFVSPATFLMRFSVSLGHMNWDISCSTRVSRFIVTALSLATVLFQTAVSGKPITLPRASSLQKSWSDARFKNDSAARFFISTTALRSLSQAMALRTSTVENRLTRVPACSGKRAEIRYRQLL